MMKPIKNQKPVLSNFLFWDTEIAKLDFNKYADFIIIRVLERGQDNDIAELLNYYGNNKVINTVKSSKSLIPRAIHLSKQLFKLQDDDFVCLRNSQPVNYYSMY